MLMPKAVLKLFAWQGTGLTSDGRQTDKAATICFPLWGA